MKHPGAAIACGAFALMMVASAARAQEPATAAERAAAAAEHRGTAVTRDAGPPPSPGGSGGGPRTAGGGAVGRESGLPVHDSSRRGFSKIEQSLEAAEGRHRAVDGPDARYSRPREGRTPIGEAIPREQAPVANRPRTRVIFDGGYPGYLYGSLYGPWRSRYSYYYDPYYWPLGVGAFGLGYFYYDPYSWWSLPTRPYGYQYRGGYAYGAVGIVRLKIRPREAEVWVDGYYAGLVDDFDGLFQHLHLDEGPHHIEIRAAGYETLALDIRVQPERTLTITRELRRLP